jgi:succinyl-CoA synthetase beta subunit
LFPEGGIDVEHAAATAAERIRLCDLDEHAMVAAIRDLASEESDDRRAAIVDDEYYLSLMIDRCC